MGKQLLFILIALILLSILFSVEDRLCSIENSLKTQNNYYSSTSIKAEIKIENKIEKVECSQANIGNNNTNSIIKEGETNEG